MVTEQRVAGWERPPLYAEQFDAVFCPHRFAITEASTKSGKTVACIAWILEQALLHGGPGRNYWWVAPVYPQAKIAYRRIKVGLGWELTEEEKTDEWVNAAYTTNESELTLTLPNQSVIWFKSGEKPDNLYGENVFAAVLDEFTRMREEVWYAIRSTLTATRGPVRMIGNVKGRKNWGYTLARKAEQESPGFEDWHYSRITAQDAVDAGYLDQAEIDAARAELPEAVFRELYEANASDDEGNPFGLKHIERCIIPDLAAGPAVACGWDIARSVDWTVGIGLNVAGQMTWYERWQKSNFGEVAYWERTQKRIAARTDAAGYMDSTGVGDPVYEAVQLLGAPLEPYHFSSKSKQVLMEGLAVSIQQQEIGITEDVAEELYIFEYEYTRTGVRYSAPPGMHDDKVMALGLAVHRFRIPNQHFRQALRDEVEQQMARQGFMRPGSEPRRRNRDAGGDYITFNPNRRF